MNYIIFDLEATCWRGFPPNGTQEIIEIGGVKVNEYSEIEGTYNAFVQPIVNPILSQFCKELTSISQENIDDADTFNIVCEEFQEWIGLEDDFVLCAWGSWDVKMLYSDCLLHELPTKWLNRSINIKRKHQKYHKLNEPMGLKRAIEAAGMEFTGIHHRAIADAENTAQLFIQYFDALRQE